MYPPSAYQNKNIRYLIPFSKNSGKYKIVSVAKIKPVRLAHT